MKKEAVSVLKPYKSKKTVNEVKKVSKKIIEKDIPNIEVRGTKRRKILRDRDVEVGNNLKNLTNIQTELKVKSKKLKFPTQTEDDKPRKRKKGTIVQNKMAVMATEEHKSETTRGRPEKKPKPRATEELIVAEKPKRTKPTIESALGIKVKSKASKEKKEKIVPEIEVEKKLPQSKSKVTKKSSDTKIKTEKIDKNSGLKLTKQHVLSSIKAVKKLAQKQLKLKSPLLPLENHPIHLQVSCVKIPKTPRRQIRPRLPHPLAGPLDEVAIFVPDLELGRRKDYEKTVEHWETIFRENGIESIKQIIPLNQVKTEYSQFEMKRKLASSFDYFLADGRICGHLTHLLGKSFFKRHNAPTPVKLGRGNLKNELNLALHKTCMEIHAYGNTHTVQIGTISMKSAKLVDNVLATCETLTKEYSGGWQNIRAIQIKSQMGPSIPIYLTLSSKNDVLRPIVRPKRPRAYQNVEGELSTKSGNTIVSMTPEGNITCKRIKNRKVKQQVDDIKEEKEEDEEVEGDTDVDDEEDDDEEKFTVDDEDEDEDDEE